MIWIYTWHMILYHAGGKNYVGCASPSVKLRLPLTFFKHACESKSANSQWSLGRSSSKTVLSNYCLHMPSQPTALKFDMVQWTMTDFYPPQRKPWQISIPPQRKLICLGGTPSPLTHDYTLPETNLALEECDWTNGHSFSGPVTFPHILLTAFCRFFADTFASNICIEFGSWKLKQQNWFPQVTCT